MRRKFLLVPIIAAIVLTYIGFINNNASRNTFKVLPMVYPVNPDLPVAQTGTDLAPTDPKATTTSQVKTTTICIGGDVNLSEPMDRYIAEGMKPFAGLTEITKDCDFFILNLECNVADANIGKRQQKNYAFKAPPSTLQVLVDNGVDAVSLANNHTKDYGAAALLDQFKHLTNYDLGYFGAGANVDQAFVPLIVDVNGLKVALLGFNDSETRIGNATASAAGSAYLNAARVNSAISQANSLSDLVIVMPHWGIEHQTKASAKQVQWGRSFIDQGADLVVGAHPHVRQNIEEYKGKKIYYSIGNFVFSGFAGRAEAQKAILVKIKVENGQIVNYQDVQLQLNFNGFPSVI